MRNKNQIYLVSKSFQKDPEILLENQINLLLKFGISSNQSKVYLCLSKMGIQTGSQLSKNLNIPRTEIYHILKILQEKGGIFQTQEKPLKFDVFSIEKFLKKTIDSEKNKIKKLEETLFLIQKLDTSNFFYKL